MIHMNPEISDTEIPDNKSLLLDIPSWITEQVVLWPDLCG